MTIIMVFDATHANINALPDNSLAALYTTGSPDIKATPQDFKNHPNAIHIVQDFGSDDTGDFLDCELGAATPQDCAIWLPNARASYHVVKRPGQRWPGIYASMNKLTPVANALVAANISNVPLWVADWGLAQAIAIQDIMNATQPFPIVGMQIQNLGLDDFSLFSSEYLDTTAHAVSAIPPMPPGPWNNARAWDWKMVATMGTGLDGLFHAFMLNPQRNDWKKLA